MTRTLLLLLAATVAGAQYTVTTSFSHNNNQAGNMFDVVGVKEVRIVGADLSLQPGTWDIEIWTTKDGQSMVGQHATPSRWEMIASATGVTSSGVDLPTPFPGSFSVEVGLGETRGFYMTSSNGAVMNYTSVATPVGNVVVDNGEVQVLDGYGVAYPFSAFFSPRRWNGTLRYYRTQGVPTDEPTLQTAIDNALIGDQVRLEQGVHGEHSIDFDGKPLRVYGAPGAVLDCGQSGRGFKFDSSEGPDSILENLEIRDARPVGPGQSGGGILVDGASPTLRGLVIDNCEATAGIGGPSGIPPNSGGPGLPGGDGGGIAVLSGNPIIQDCTVKLCRAGNGGIGGVGIFGASGGPGGDGGRGGGIFIGDGSPLVVGTLVIDCEAGNGGNGQSGQAGGDGGDGGGLCVAGGTPLVTGCRMISNATGEPGLGWILGGHRGGDGGGLALHADLGTLTSCVLAKNTCGAGGDGAGLFIAPGIAMDIRGCTIADNTAGPASSSTGAGDGGGIRVDASCTVANTIFYQNSPDEIFGPPSVDSCLVWGGYPGNGNIDAFPNFISPFQDDYHLHWLSVCVGAGDPAYAVASRDVDGEPRIIGTGLDIGADEVIINQLDGTNEDFILETTINGEGDPIAQAKFAKVGDLLSMHFESPGGLFDHRPPLLFAQFFFTGTALPSFPSIAGIHVPMGFAVFDGLAGSPFGPTLMPPGGMTFNATIPVSLPGVSVRIQALAFAGHANNGIFPVSDAHDVVIE